MWWGRCCGDWHSKVTLLLIGYMEDPSHPLHSKFQLSPSRTHFRQPQASKKNQYRMSFEPTANIILDVEKT